MRVLCFLSSIPDDKDIKISTYVINFMTDKVAIRLHSFLGVQSRACDALMS